MEKLNKPRFFHLRNFINGRITEKGGETFYVVPVGKDLLEVSHARCCPTDNYSRKIGRKICINRMGQMQSYLIPRNLFLTGLSYNRTFRANMPRRVFEKSRKHALKKFGKCQTFLRNS